MERLFWYQVKSDSEDPGFFVYRVSSMTKPKDHSIMFLTPKNLDEAPGIARCHQCLIFVPEGFDAYDNVNGHCIVKCQNPRKEYALLVNTLVSSEDEMGEGEWIHGSWISKDAVIGKNVQIFPGCYIGSRTEIGEGSILYPGVRLHGPAKIGKHAVIRDHAVIGIPGFGFVSDPGEAKIRFPSLGSVVIGDHVEIGALSVVAKAIIDETVLEDGVKLDASTFIAHDGHIGADTLVVSAKTAGHVTIGKGCFIGLGALVKQRVRIGDHCTIGAGAVVVRPVADDDTVAGVPAHSIRK